MYYNQDFISFLNYDANLTIVITFKLLKTNSSDQIDNRLKYSFTFP